MSDFQLQGEISIDQSGLTKFEAAAAQSGEEAGKSLNEGIQKGSKGAGEALAAALKKGADAAEREGKKAGEELAKGVDAGSKKIPGYVSKQLKKAEGEGQKTGKKIGDGVAKGVEQETKSEIPAALKAAVQKAEQQGKTSGKKLGTNTSAGFKQGSKNLSVGIVEQLKKAAQKGTDSGKQTGDNFETGFEDGLEGMRADLLDELFRNATREAEQSGNKAGTRMGQGVKAGVSKQQQIFATVIAQAQAAARKADLIFDQTTLDFRFPDGGIVPQSEITRLTGLDQATVKAVGSLNKMGPAAKDAGNAAARAGQDVGRLKSQSLLLDGVVAGLTATLSGGLLQAFNNLGRSITSTISNFAQLDQQIRLANSATGEGQAGYNNLKSAIDRVGIEAAASQGDIALLATQLTRAGMTSEEAAAVMPSVARAAEGTGTAFESMAKIVGASLKTFQLDVEDSATVTDILVAAANSSATSVDGLGEALMYAAPAAKSLDISMADTVATIGLLANAGIDASNAGTGLRTMLTRLSLAASGASGESLGLTRGQEKLANAMKILGAEVIDANGKLLPMDQTMKALKASMEDLSSAEKVELSTALFGEQGATKFLGIVNQSDKAIGDMFDTVRNSTGATDTARKNMEGLQTSFDQLSGSLDVMAGTFAKVIGTAIRPIVDALANTIDVFNKLPGPIKEVVAALGIVAGALTTAKIATLTFGAAMSNVAFKAAITQITALGSAIKKGLIADFRLAVTGVRNFGTALSKVNYAAATTALLNLGKALLTLKWNTAAQGAFQFAKALNLVKTGGDLNSLKNAAANLVGLNRQLVYTTDAAGKTKKSIELMAKSGSKIGPMALKAKGGMAALGAASGAVAVKVAAVAVAAWPVTVALAAIGTAAVAYNGIMKQSRDVTEALQPTIDDVAESAEKAGIEFRDLGKQGDPLANAMKDAGGWVEALGDKLGEIPVVGKAAQMAWQRFIKVLGYTPFGLAIKGVTKLVGWMKEMYKTASDNQAFIEGAEQLEQFEEVTGATARKAMELKSKLENLGDSLPADEFKKTTEQAATTATELTKQAKAAKNLEQKYRDLAEAARADGNEEQARRWDTLADSANASAKQLEAVKEKLIGVTGATKEGAEALEAYSGKVDATTKQVIALNQATADVDLNLKGADLTLQSMKAAADLQNQRFDTAKAFYQYELNQLQGVEGAEGRRAELKRKIKAIEEDQWQASWDALNQQIAQEREILQLNQEQARLKAATDVLEAQIAVKEQEIALQEAINSGEKETIDLEKSKLALQESVLGIRNQQAERLSQFQALETQILQTQQATASEAMKTKGALEGWLTPANDFQNAMYSTNTAVGNVRTAAGGIGNELEKSVIKSRTLADGTIEVWNETVKVGTALKGANAEAGKMNTGLQDTSGALSVVQQRSNDLATTLQGAAGAATVMGEGSEKTEGAIGELNPTQLSDQLQTAATEADKLGNAAAGTSAELNQIPDLSTTVTQMGGMASNAQTIANSDMAGVMSSMDSSCNQIAGSMETAANNANNFYTAMKNAAGIPCNKWSGGDVKAGQRYIVNEMGQESFRSRSGNLSLIRKPAFGQWRAPSDGVVLPAGMTTRLQQEGAFDRQPGMGGGQNRSGSDPMAQLMPVIGKLNRSVDDLVAKDWNVQVRVRNSEGSTALSMLNKMRT